MAKMMQSCPSCSNWVPFPMSRCTRASNLSWMEISFIGITLTLFPGFIIVVIRELIIQIEKAFIATYSRDDINDKTTIKR